MRNLLRYLVGLVFIVSSITKLADFRGTSYFLASILGTQYAVTKFLLALLILIELALGTMIMIKHIHHQLVSIGFIWKGVSNCGCFGTVLVVKPLPTILKNLFLIGVLVILKKEDRKNDYAS